MCVGGFEGDRCEEFVCKNNGTWVNDACQCTPNFQGPTCEAPRNSLEIKNATVNATVEMGTKIEEKFNDNLKDQSSEEYQKFVKRFQNQMREIYKNIKGYQGVEIRSLSEGSIVVNYTVIVAVAVTTKVNETMKDISENLVTALENQTSCNDSCTGTDCPFCFNATATKVLVVPKVEGSVCRSLIQNEFREFYTDLLTTDGVICITRCDDRHSDSLKCSDYGSCSVGRTGAQCECSDRAAYWYQDELCNSRVSKLAVGVGVPVAILVLVTTIFTILLVQSRRQKKNDRNEMRSHTDLYDSDDGNWEGPQGFAVGNAAATWEDMETPSTSYINLERVDTSKMMHIRRPIVVP